MVGLIVTGHGNFATGLISALNLIAGEQDNLIGVDFKAEYSTEILEGKLKEAISKVECEEILVLADLAGGSPFKIAVILSQVLGDKKIKVLSGTNLGMLIETSLCRVGMDLDEVVEFAENSGKDSIKVFEVKEKDEIDEEDGI